MNYSNAICPIYFEDHQFGGHVSSIENFTNIDLGTIRTTFLNGRPYFCAADICKGLCLDQGNTSDRVTEAVNDILEGYYNKYPVDNIPTFSDLPGITNYNYLLPVRRGEGHIDPEELYFIIKTDISYKNKSGKMVTQKVNTIFISEPVLYMLTFRSRKKEAIAFKAWLAMDVLPNLRALGNINTINAIGGEYMMIVNSLRKIDSIYNKMENYEAAESMIKNAIHDISTGQRSENEAIAQIQDALMNIYQKTINLNGMGNSILGNTMVLNNKTDALIGGSMEISDKVTNIASGLNMIFGNNHPAMR